MRAEGTVHSLYVLVCTCPASLRAWAQGSVSSAPYCLLKDFTIPFHINSDTSTLVTFNLHQFRGGSRGLFCTQGKIKVPKVKPQLTSGQLKI